METEEITALEGLEATQRGLTQRIADMVSAAQRGENDGSEIATLTQRVAALSEQIEAAKDEQEQAERERARAANLQARAELPRVLAAATEQRELFLSSYRTACLSLGRFLELRAQAGSLVGKLSTAQFGPWPADLSELRALDLGSAPTEAIADLQPDTGEGWRMSFSVTPLHKKAGR